VSGDGDSEGFGDIVRRVRWRLRGAWMAPSFAVLTIAEAVMLHVLPLAGRTPVVGAFILCGILNLIVVAVFAPLTGLMLRRTRPDLPRDVATDRAGTFWLVVLFAVLLAIGIVNAGH
jgi:amino acid transporter